MPVQPNTQPTKAFISLSELAEDLLGLSRARVYELIERGALPQPIYDLRTRRPIFDADLQRQCIAVRQTGLGLDGSAVIFYRRDRQPIGASTQVTQPQSRRRTSIPQANRHAGLIASLQSLGVGNATEQSVAAAVAECFPNGTETQQESDVLRAVFRVLRRQGTA